MKKAFRNLGAKLLTAFSFFGISAASTAQTAYTFPPQGAPGAIMTFKSGPLPAGTPGNAAALMQAVNAAINTPAAGYGSAVITNSASVQNQALVPNGSSANIAEVSTFAFGLAQPTTIQFRAGLDTGTASSLVIDGVPATFMTADQWWNGNWNNAGGVSMTQPVTLPAGNHTFQVFGLEPCCSGAQSFQYMIAGGQWTNFSANDPKLAVLRLGATGAIMTYMSGPLPIGVRPSTATDLIQTVRNAIRTPAPGYGRAFITNSAKVQNQALVSNGSATNIAEVSTFVFGLARPTSIEFRAGLDTGLASSLVVDGKPATFTTGDQWWEGNWNNVRGVSTTTAMQLTAGNHTFQVYGLEACCSAVQSFQYRIQGGQWTNFSDIDSQMAVLQADALPPPMSSVNSTKVLRQSAPDQSGMLATLQKSTAVARMSAVQCSPWDFFCDIECFLYPLECLPNLRIKIPGVSDEINAIWQAAVDETDFGAKLAHYVESKLKIESGVLLSDVPGLLKDTTIDQIVPAPLMTYIRSAEKPGSELNSKIQGFYTKSIAFDVGKGTYVNLIPDEVDVPDPITERTEIPSSVFLGNIGHKYSFTLLPQFNVTVPTSVWAKESEDPLAYVVPDISMSVGFPLLQIKERVHLYSEKEGNPQLRVPNKYTFPVKMVFGLVWPLSVPLPDPVVDSLDLGAGVAAKFGVAMTCKASVAGACRIDNFSLSLQLKASVDTFKTVQQAYEMANYAASWAAELVGWSPRLIDWMSPQAQTILESVAPGGSMATFLGADATLGGEMSAFMGGAVLESETGAVITGTDALSTGFAATLQSAVDALSGESQVIVSGLNQVSDTTLNIIGVPEEGRFIIESPIEDAASGVDLAAETATAMLEDAASVARSSAEDPVVLVNNIFESLGTFCSKKSWPSVGSWNLPVLGTRKLNSLCSIETKVDILAGLVWRNPYTRLDDWKNGYEVHASPDVEKLVISIREVGGVEFGIENAVTVKARVVGIFSEAVLYKPLTSLGVDSMTDTNEDEMD